MSCLSSISWTNLKDYCIHLVRYSIVRMQNTFIRQMEGVCLLVPTFKLNNQQFSYMCEIQFDNYAAFNVRMWKKTTTLKQFEWTFNCIEINRFVQILIKMKNWMQTTIDAAKLNYRCTSHSATLSAGKKTMSTLVFLALQNNA